jgi:hypothetical protein
MRVSLVLVALVFLVQATPQSSAGESYIVGSQTFTFDPGQGYCPFDANASGIDRALLDWQSKSLKGTNILLGFFTTCEELTALRTAQIKYISKWRSLLAVLRNGKLERAHGVSRGLFIDVMTKSMARGVDLDTESLSERMTKALPDDVAKKIGKVGLSETRQLGVIHRDESALYFAYLLDLSVRDYNKTVAGVTAMTLMKGYMVTFNNYGEFVDRSSIERLLKEAQAVAQDMVARNEPAE